MPGNQFRLPEDIDWMSSFLPGEVPHWIMEMENEVERKEMMEVIHKKLGNHKINIPHKRMHNRNFVLFPLFELDKDWVHPILNKNIVILMLNLSSDQLLGIKIT